MAETRDRTAGKTRRPFRIEDMERFVYVSAPAVTPDGREVVFVRYHPDRETGRFPGRLYRVSCEGGEAVPVTAGGRGSEDRPAFSPDGRRLAYLAPGAHEPQIWIIDWERQGSPVQVTTLRHGVSAFAWSPDGRRIAFVTRTWPSETDEEIFREMTVEERERWEWELTHMPRATEELMYKLDETFGMVDGSVRRIGVLDLERGTCRLLTDPKDHADRPAWSHDGRRIAYHRYIYRHDKANRCEIFVMDVESGEERQVTFDSAYLGSSPPVFAPDDRSIIHAAWLDPKGPFVPELVRTPIDGGEPERLFPDEEVCHGVATLWQGRTVYGAMNPEYQLGGRSVYFTSSWQGRTHIYRLDLEGPRRIQWVTHGDISVRTFCAPVNGRLIFTGGDAASLDEVYCLDEGDEGAGAPRRLTWSNPWLDEVAVSPPEELRVATADGSARIHGWVVPPVHVEPGRRYPAVLYIRGGPQATWTMGWWHEVQALAARGIGVIYCDPRGSTGYGRDFAADSFAWGDEAVSDLLTFLDAALACHRYLDPERVGVTGGSYGGYMTVKLLGKHPERFKAAVAQRVFCNPATSYGTGDIGFISSLDPEKRPRTFKDYLFDRARRSLLGNIDRMKVPLLILHGMQDYRCGVEQAEQLFAAMKDRNPEVPVRIVLFPGENHDLTRTGRIASQMRHLEEMVAWFERFLVVEGGEAGGGTEAAASA